MRRRKRLDAVKYLLAAVIAAGITAFFFLHRETVKETTSLNPQPLAKQQTGYKTEDRQKLEKLIHNGGKDD